MHFGSDAERSGSGAFRPRAVLALLDGVGIDHQVLQRLHQASRDLHGRPRRPAMSESRCTYFDLANIFEMARLLVESDARGVEGRPAVFRTARLLKDLQAVRRLGFAFPLLQFHLTYSGLGLVARDHDEIFRASGQLLLDDGSLARSNFLEYIYAQVLDADLRARLREVYEDAQTVGLQPFDERYPV